MPDSQGENDLPLFSSGPNLGPNSSPNNEYFHVILPGLKGGGRNLTGLREYIGSRGWVTASLSTRVGLKRGFCNLKAHYRKLALDLIAQSQGRTIRIYAHSLGGVEVLYLMKELAHNKDLPHHTLEIIFISPPGVGQKGFSGLLKVGKRLGNVIKNLGLYDQDYLLPVPTLEGNPVNPQRKLFLDDWLPRLLIDPVKREQFKQALEAIDSKILLADVSKRQPAERGHYQQERHKLLKDLVEKIINGQHITEEKHQQFLQKHQELALNIAPGFSYIVTSFLFVLRVFFNLYLGLDRKLFATYDYCRKQSVNTKVAVVILGHDELVFSGDYANFIKMASARKMPVYNFVFENEEHSSVALKWSLIDALESLELSPNPA
jgi:hypothetical protein